METSDTGKSGSRFENFGRRVDQNLGSAIPRVEEEIRKVISYLNDEVVPQIRQDSSQALRAAAEQLHRLAEHLESNRPGGAR